MITLYKNSKYLRHIKVHYFSKGLSEAMLTNLKTYRIPLNGISFLTNKVNTIAWNTALGEKVLGKFI